MTKIFVPVIINEKAELFELSVTERNDQRTKKAGILLKNEYFPLYVDAIKSNFTDLHHNVNFVSQTGASFDVFTSATYSARLGIYLALEQQINQRKFKEEWDGVVVTGNLNADNDLLEVSEIQEKYKALIDFISSNPGNFLFVYVNKNEINMHPHEKVSVLRITEDNSTEELMYDLFSYKISSFQESILRKVPEINHSHIFFPTVLFQKLKKIASDSSWPGCCILGENNTGKSNFCYNLNLYLLSTKKFDVPIWINLDNRLLSECRQKKMPLEIFLLSKITEYAQQNSRILLTIDIKNAIFDFEIYFSLLNLKKSFSNKIAIIINSVSQANSVLTDENNELKTYRIDSISETECEKIICNELKRIGKEEIVLSSDFEVFNKLIYEKYRNYPGLIYKITDLLTKESLTHVVKKILTCEIEEIEETYLKEVIVSHLSSFESKLLSQLVLDYTIHCTR